MALNAGAVYAVLGGRFNSSAFVAFDAKLKQSAATMRAAEAQITASSSRMNKGMVAVGKVGAVAAGAGILGMGVAIAKSVGLAADFEAQLSRLKATTGANAQQMAQFKRDAMSAGAATKFSAMDAAKAQVELAKGGLAVEQMSGGLKAALGLAAAGEMDLALAAQTTVNAMKQFGIDGEQATHVADALATAANTTTADVEHFAMALTQGGGAARNAGISLDETVALLQAFADNSVKSSDAGTSLKTMLTQLADPTAKQRDAAKALNLELWDQNERLKPLPAIAGELDSAFGGLTDKQRLAAASTIAGQDGMRGLLALYQSSPGAMQGYLDGLKAEGTAAAVAAEKQDNLRGKIENLKGSLETAGIALGEGLLPGLTEGAEKMTAAINDMVASGQLQEFGRDIGTLVSPWLEAGPAMVVGMEAGMKAFSVGVKSTQMVWLGFMATLTAGLEIVTAMVDAWNALPLGQDLEIDTSKLAKARDDAKAVTAQLIRDVTGVKPTVELRIKGNPVDAERALKRVQAMGLSDKVMKILGKDVSATAKIKQLRALGIPEKYARILGQNADALAKIGSVQAALNALNDRTVTLTLNKRTVETLERGAPIRRKPPVGGLSRKATGRGPVGAERALVGEGRGPELHVDATGRMQVVDRPTIMDLGAEDWVIPYGDRSQAGRALGLMLDMLGIPGYAKGKRPKKKKAAGKAAKPLPIPDAITFAAVPEDALTKERDDARERYQKRKERVRDLDVDIREQRKRVSEAKGGPAKSKAQRKLRDLKSDRDNYLRGKGGIASSLADMRRRYEDLQRQLAVLHKANLEIERLNAQQEAARTRMETAAKTGDVKSWQDAKTRRGGLLGTLREKYALALKHAKPDTRFAAELESKLAGAEGDISDLGRESLDSIDPFEGTGMTKAERDALAQIEMQGALAALTAPLDDDTAAARAKVGFFEQVLGAAMSDPSRGGPAVIADLAGRLKSERDNLASLTGSNAATNDNADLQAQIEQARESERVALRKADINAKALSVFQGAGDIGMGGPRIVQNFSMLVAPTDPRQLKQVGDAATSGISQQPAVRSPRSSLGF